MPARWSLAPECPADFSVALGVSPIVGQLLWNRGLKTKEEAEAFFEPSWEKDLHDPAQFRHLPKALKLIFEALEQNKQITVHGDYDADGVTGSTVLINTLRELERHVRPGQSTVIDFYIPHREREGYGLHKSTVPKLKEHGTQLVITVDCGIACVEEIAAATAEAMDTIVVDHHQFGEVLPEACLIHPGLPEETYPFKKLAAVGVSFKFATALLEEGRRRGYPIASGWEKWLLDLVAIATITDVVPLVGENRLLEQYGLKVLNKTRRPGLLALIEQAGLELGKLDSESIGFAIGPRINAAGRMEHAGLALELMLAQTTEEAQRLALELERCNKARQDATKVMMKEAEEQLEDRYGTNVASYPKLLTFWRDDWSPSLVGLVAGRFMERFSRPIVAVGHFEGNWIGSGRSLPIYDVTTAVKTAGEGILTRSGGHIQACGFALTDASRLSEFADKLAVHAGERLTEEQLVPELAIEAEIPLSLLDWDLVNTVGKFAPFGEGNRRPMFVSKRCFVSASAAIGKTGSHWRLQLSDGRGKRVGCIGFKMGERAEAVPYGSFVDVVYHLDVNEWQGRKEIQLKLLDVRVSS